MAYPIRPSVGGAPKLTTPEKERVQVLLKTHPNVPNTVLAALQEETGKTISRSTLKRIARGAGLRWKRVFLMLGSL